MIVRQWALPFRSVASVYVWERAASALTSVLLGCGIPCLRCIDDRFLVVPGGCGAAGRQAAELIVAFLGWLLEQAIYEGLPLR